MSHGTPAKGQKVTPKQRAFVEAFVLEPNATAAARTAGYAHPAANGHRILQLPNVKAEVERLQAERSERVAIDSDYILRELQEIYLRLKQAVRPALNSKTGKPLKDPDTGEPLYKFDSSGALKALELMGKHTEVKAFDTTVNLKVDGLTMAERILEGRKRSRRALVEDGEMPRLQGAAVVAIEDAPPALIEARKVFNDSHE